MNNHRVEASITLAAQLTIYQAAECYATLSDVLQRYSELHLDLSAVTEIDSAGMQVLLQLARQAGLEGFDIRFLTPSEEIAALMQLYQLTADFDTTTEGPGRI